MAVTQTVLFTVIPRGVVLNSPTLPVSVLVSPRLVGADRLDAFPDLVDWTQKLTGGIRMVFDCDGRTATVPVDTSKLRPDLWRALFGPDTFVRSRAFDDYSSHGVVSFSVRESLSALKAVYQEAGIVLAMPDPPDETDPNEQEPGESGRFPGITNRQRLGAILNGLDVHWNADIAKRWREVARHRSTNASGERALNGPLDRKASSPPRATPRRSRTWLARSVRTTTCRRRPRHRPDRWRSIRTRSTSTRR